MFIFACLQGRPNGTKVGKLELLLRISHPSAECKYQEFQVSGVRYQMTENRGQKTDDQRAESQTLSCKEHGDWCIASIILRILTLCPKRFAVKS